MAHTPTPTPTPPLDLLKDAGFYLDQRALDVIRIHFEVLQRWNRKINLTAVHDPQQIIRRHFIESLYLTRLVRLGPGVLYDVGSGAGFPGLPLKAACPEMELILVESSQKRAAFLKEVIRAAGLVQARVEARRIQELVGEPNVKPASWVTMRAVGGVTELVPLLRKLIVPRGTLALFLGERDAGAVRDAVRGFVWKPPVKLPESERRVILLGIVD